MPDLIDAAINIYQNQQRIFIKISNVGETVKQIAKRVIDKVTEEGTKGVVHCKCLSVLLPAFID